MDSIDVGLSTWGCPADIQWRFKTGDMDNVTGTMWLGISALMVMPILMILVTLLFDNPVNRMANIIVAGFFFIFNLVGLPTYPGAYDKFLLIISLGFNIITIWLTWHWV